MLLHAKYNGISIDGSLEDFDFPLLWPILNFGPQVHGNHRSLSLNLYIFESRYYNNDYVFLIVIYVAD
jgi:hypothetical protein